MDGVDPAGEPSGASVPGHHQSGDPVRILIVGPDEAYRTLFRAALHQLDAAVPVEALYLDSRGHARLAMEAGNVDAVLADFLLPDGTGDQVLHEAERLAPHSHRILLSHRPDETGVGSPHAVWDKSARGYELRSSLERLVMVRRLRNTRGSGD